VGRIRVEALNVSGCTNPPATPPTTTKCYTADEVDAPVDSSASGVAETTTLNATNVSFSPGQKILIHQSRGSGAGNWEINEIQSYSPARPPEPTPLRS
jgi:hypothetical protein